MEFKNLLELIKAVSDSELTGLKYEEKGVKIQLTKTLGEVQVVHASAAPAQAAQPIEVTAAVSPAEVQPVEAPVQELTGKLVNSPLVGTFYTASSEDAPPFVSVGDTVKKGQTLAIVEAMKLMNEIESEFDGTITEVLVENGQGVEYGQPLFRIS